MRRLQHPFVFSLYLPTLIFAFCQGLIIPVLPLYALEFDISYGWVGLVLAGQALGMLFGDVPSGVLLRQFGRKRSMLLGLGLATLATAALFWVSLVWLAVLCRILSGFGVALFNVSRHAYLAEEVMLVSRGRAIALYGGINRIGKFLAPAAGGFIAAGFGLRVPFLIFGGICLAALIMIALAVQATGQSTITDKVVKFHTGHLLSVLTNNYQVLMTAGAAQLLAQTIRAGVPVIIPLYGAVIGLDVRAIGLILSVTGGIDMTLFYPAGWLMDRWGRKWAIVPCFFIQAVAMALIPLTGSFASLLTIGGVIGFGNGLGSGTMMTLGADLAPKESRGEFLGVWRLIGDSGMAGAPLVVGWVAALVVLQSAIWVIAGAGLLSALMFAFFVPETLHRRLEIMGKSTAIADSKT